MPSNWSPSPPSPPITLAQLQAMQAVLINTNTQPQTQGTSSPTWVFQAPTPQQVVADIEVTDNVPKRRNDLKYYNNQIGEWWISSNNHKPGDIGLEIECEGLNLFTAPIQWWNAHNDGSLRSYNQHPPIEYVLKEPLKRDQLDSAFAYLSAKLKSSGSVVVDSPRTSVHVHVNCQKMTIKQAINYILCYLIVEDFLVEFCGHDRVGNLFCLRAKDASYFTHMLVQGIRSDDYSLVTSNEYRYMSCNVASLKKFGSLEFRSMKGTVDFKLISEWIDLLLYIKEQSLTFDNPQEIIRYFDSEGVDGVLRKILPDEWYARFKHHPEKTKIVWDNVRAVREVAYAIPEWEPLVKEEPKLKKKVGKYKYIPAVDGGPQVVLNPEYGQEEQWSQWYDDPNTF